MQPDHLLAELRRRIDLAAAKLEEAATHAARLGASIDKTGLYSDASRELQTRFTCLGDEYNALVADVESVRQVLEARTKCRGTEGKTPAIHS